LKSQSYIGLSKPSVVGREHLEGLYSSKTARLTTHSLTTVIRKLQEVCPGMNVKLPEVQATAPPTTLQSGTSRQSQARAPSQSQTRIPPQSQARIPPVRSSLDSYRVPPQVVHIRSSVDNHRAPSQSVLIHGVDLSAPIRSAPVRDVDSRPQVHHPVRPNYGSLQPNRSYDPYHQASRLESGGYNYTGRGSGGESRGGKAFEWICTVVSMAVSAAAGYFFFKKFW